MSRRHWQRAVLLIALALSFGGLTRRLAAQVTVAEQTARVAALQRLSKAAEVLADSMARARRARVQVDTIRAGPLTVLAEPVDVVLVRAGATLAWRRLAPMFRADTLLLKREWYYLLIAGGHGSTIGRSGGIVRASMVGAGGGAPGVAEHLTGVVATSVLDGASHDFWEWIGGSVPLTDDSTTLSRVYVDLVTAPSQAVHKCYAGDLPACAIALTLDSVAEPASAWYGPGERELVVRMTRVYNGDYTSARDQAERGVLSRCLSDHEDFSCLAYLRSLPPHMIRPPLGQVARASATRLALALGGAGAYTRLVSTHGGAGSRIVAAAGVPMDSVMTAWRAEVLAAKPPSEHVSAATQWSTVFWVVVLAALALRGSQWRSA